VSARAVVGNPRDFFARRLYERLSSTSLSSGPREQPASPSRGALAHDYGEVRFDFR